MHDDKILVFLSRPNPFLDSHQYFILKLQEHFEKYNIQTVTLQADNYDLTDSINYLKGMIKQCYGIAIIGFKQIFIETGSKKKGGRKDSAFYYPVETDMSGQALTSPFCHIEGTIGLLNDLPLLVINEEGVREEDGGIQEDAPHGKEEHRPRYAQETAERLLLVRQRAS